MTSLPTSTIFDSTSPFLKFCTENTRGIIMSLLRLIAHTYHLGPSGVLHAYFDDINEAPKTVGFKQLLNNYFQRCCDEYLITHQQIIDGKKHISDLNESNSDEFVYCVMQKIMSQINGYKHMNCIFDNAMIICVLQFKYVFNSMTNNIPLIGSSSVIPNGLFLGPEGNLLRFVFDQHLTIANEKLTQLYLSNDQHSHIRLNCDENNTCGLDISLEKQRQKQLREAMNLEGQTYKHQCATPP